MKHESELRWFSPRALWVAAAVSGALAYSTQSGALSGRFVQAEWITNIPYANAAIASFSDALIMVVLTSAAAPKNPLGIVGLSGTNAPLARAALWALMWFAPALAVCLIAASRAQGVSAPDIVWLAFGGPFTEEFVYRGLAVGVLMRVAGWPLVAACVWPAVFFGLIHFGQGADLGTIAGVVAITTAGGLLFGWLFVRWGFNLWPAIFLHVGLNGLFVIFDLGQNAIGGWLLNVVRLGVVLVAIVASIWFAPTRQQARGADAKN